MSLGGGGGGRAASEEERQLYATQASIAREQWDAYSSTVLPAQRELISEARRPITRGEYAAATSGAAADVDQSFDAATRRFRSEVGRYGGNPLSGRYAGSMRQLALGRATARAGAMTSARRNLQARRDRLRYASVGMGSGLGRDAQRGLASAGQGYASISDRMQRARVLGPERARRAARHRGDGRGGRVVGPAPEDAHPPRRPARQWRGRSTPSS